MEKVVVLFNLPPFIIPNLYPLGNGLFPNGLKGAKKQKKAEIISPALSSPTPTTPFALRKQNVFYWKQSGGIELTFCCLIETRGFDTPPPLPHAEGRAF